MRSDRQVAIWIDHRDPAAVAEAWRAAVGVSLRGAAVTVVPIDGSADGGPGAARARATLALFGHAIDGTPAALRTADVIECWRDGAPPSPTGAPPADDRSLLHLVRAGRTAGPVAAGDRVVRLGDDVDHGDLLDVLAGAGAGAVCVW